MGITVLSLFDGISCGMVALERAGIEVDKYIAYEIEHNAIEISKKNYPEDCTGQTYQTLSSQKIREFFLEI